MEELKKWLKEKNEANIVPDNFNPDMIYIKLYHPEFDPKTGKPITREQIRPYNVREWPRQQRDLHRLNWEVTEIMYVPEKLPNGTEVLTTSQYRDVLRKKAKEAKSRQAALKEKSETY